MESVKTEQKINFFADDTRVFTSRFQDRAWIFRQNDSAEKVYFIKSGSVEIVQYSEEGQAVVVKLLNAPCCMGIIEALAGNAYYQECVRAFGDIELIGMHKNHFLEWLMRFPKDAHHVYLDLAIAFSVAAKFQAIASHESEARIANLLLAYFECDPSFEKKARNFELNIRRTQDDLAEGTASSLRTVSRIIQKWKAEGLVEKIDGRWICYQPEQLKSIAGELYGSLVHCYGVPNWFGVT